MSSQQEVTVEYIRPGKDVSHYTEDLVYVNDFYLKTFKYFPPEIAENLSGSLQKNGFILESQRTVCITKIYFFQEHFNVLQFQDEGQQTLGYYSDIGTPLIKTEKGYQMTDWFLDIWLSPGGRLFELDMDEFEEAISKNLLGAREAEIAKQTFQRLIHEVNQGIYPNAYLK
jgi:predicted RNA-binding protein associated with RNAse of E/G family